MHMILVFLAAVWAAFLLPSVLRRHFSKASIESVDTFHHALAALDHSEPASIHPSEAVVEEVPHSLLPPIVPVHPRPTVGTIPRLVVLRADGTPVPLPEPAATPIDTEGSVVGAGRRPYTDDHGSPRTVSAEDPARARVRTARRRRRDILLILVGVTSGTGLLGMIGPLEVLWAITLLGGLSTVAFVALAVRSQLLEEERRQKLRYFPSGTRGRLVSDHDPMGEASVADAIELRGAAAGR
jgi:hypothetical protein